MAAERPATLPTIQSMERSVSLSWNMVTSHQRKGVPSFSSHSNLRLYTWAPGGREAIFYTFPTYVRLKPEESQGQISAKAENVLFHLKCLSTKSYHTGISYITLSPPISRPIFAEAFSKHKHSFVLMFFFLKINCLETVFFLNSLCKHK